jgi:hypothetical protein
LICRYLWLSSLSNLQTRQRLVRARCEQTCRFLSVGVE